MLRVSVSVVGGRRRISFGGLGSVIRIAYADDAEEQQVRLLLSVVIRQ